MRLPGSLINLCVSLLLFARPCLSNFVGLQRRLACAETAGGNIRETTSKEEVSRYSILCMGALTRVEEKAIGSVWFPSPYVKAHGQNVSLLKQNRELKHCKLVLKLVYEEDENLQ